MSRLYLFFAPLAAFCLACGVLPDPKPPSAKEAVEALETACLVVKIAENPPAESVEACKILFPEDSR